MNLRHLKISQKVADVQSDEIIKRLLVQEVKCLVRCYIVSAYGLADRDNDSHSDPFVVVKLGDKKTYNDRENYKDDEPNPDIYKQFNVAVDFGDIAKDRVGSSMLKIASTQKTVGGVLANLKELLGDDDAKSDSLH